MLTASVLLRQDSLTVSFDRLNIPFQLGAATSSAVRPEWEASWSKMKKRGEKLKEMSKRILDQSGHWTSSAWRLP